MPSTDGTADQVLMTDGSGILSWGGTKQVVAGGCCVWGISGKWDTQTTTWGGASCDMALDVAQVQCLGGSIKRVVFRITADVPRGGEGVICIQ